MSQGLSSITGRRLLFLNWRDMSHPRAGGAEVYCEQVAQRFVEAGASVTLFTSAYPGAPLAELRRGVEIVRSGGTLGVYARAAEHLHRRRTSYDAVVDFQNGIPFFSPLFSGRRTAVVCVIHHVHQEQFALHYPWPASKVGQLLEGPVSRWVYHSRPLVAVSPSTRSDVRRQLRLGGPIHVIPNGLVEPGEVTSSRSATPRIAVTSRLVSHKRFELLVDALPDLRRRWPDLTVDIAGDGPERRALELRAARLGVADVVRFHGFVDDSTKHRIVGEAWLTVSPSQAEGWGLTIIEANAAGLPAVAFDVPGLRDAIVPGETGWLLPPGRSLSDGIDEALRTLQDHQVAQQWAARCRAWAGRFSWDSTADRIAAVVSAEIDRAQRGPRSRRVRTDLAVRADAQLPEGVGAEHLSRGLRRSDQRWFDGDRVQLLLHGCDEAGVAVALRRLGIVDVRRLTLATAGDLLVGAESR